jgi:TRAP-type uncharacterized transport system fused permease subunit
LDYVQVYRGKRKVQCFTGTLITAWPSYLHVHTHMHSRACFNRCAQQFSRACRHLVDMLTVMWFYLITVGLYVCITLLVMTTIHLSKASFMTYIQIEFHCYERKHIYTVFCRFFWVNIGPEE